MAKRTQVTSVKSPPGESPPAERWWKTPTVVAAIIAATAAVIVAIIGLGTPKSKPLEPMHIDQQTHGPNSPAIADLQGDVHVTYGISEEK